MTSDLSILEEFGAQLAPEDELPPAYLRHQVVNGMRQPARRPRMLPRLTGVRLAWRLGVPAVAAVAVGAALITVQLPGDAGRPAPPAPGVQAQPQPHVVPQPPDAGQVLQLAAQHSADIPALDARADQFLYIDSVEVQSELLSHGKKVSKPLPTRSWLSVDGTHDGLVVQGSTRTRLDGCTNGRQAETIDRPDTTPEIDCVPEPAYRPGRIPTDADALLEYVYAQAAEHPVYLSLTENLDDDLQGFVKLSDDQVAFTTIARLLSDNQLPAVQEAALQAARQIPGVEVRRDAKDASGRTGVAVTRTEAGSREELVFDATSYKYLGLNIIGAAFDRSGIQVIDNPPKKGSVSIGPLPKAGEIVYQSALLSVAIVDRAGQRP